MYLILFAVLVFTILYLYLLKSNKHWHNKGVPYERPTILFGNLLNTIRRKENIADFVNRVYQKFHGHRYVGIQQFTKPILIIRDLELIKQIAIRDSDSLTDHQALTNEEIDPLWSRNLAASRGQKWHHLRTALSPSFTSTKMKMMYGLINICADNFVQYYEKLVGDGDTYSCNIKEEFSRFSNDAIASCAFGIECDSLREKNNDFYLAGQKGVKGLTVLKLFLFPLAPFLLKYLNIKIISEEVGNFFKRIIKDSIRTREEQKIVRPDMVHLMMQLRKKLGKEAMTDEDITAQALVFFFAGYESSAILMSFVAYELAVNPALQTRLRHEIDDTLAANNGTLTYDVLMGMKYLDMVVTETLRKWPFSPITDRIVTKDQYIIPAERPGETSITLQQGESVWFPIYAIHRDPELFPEPDKFDPERFNDQNRNTSMKRFLTFGLGPRNCIGSRFAQMESKAILVKLLDKFEIVPVDKTNIPMKVDKAQFALQSKGGWWLGLKRRQIN